MAINLSELVNMIEDIAPTTLQDEWDNSGVQLAFHAKPIHRVLVCLEVTGEVIEEAAEKQVDFIVTHHPLIFGSITSIDDRSLTGRYLTRLMNLGVSVYSCHTPFDKVDGGNNDYLADLLGLRDICSLMQNGESNPIARVGQFLEIQTLAQVDQLVEERLELYTAAVVGHPETQIKTVALCTGAGSGLLEAVAEDGCQLFITGDVKYHDAQKAKELGLCMIDAGHYGTEKFFSRNFSEQLRVRAGRTIEILESEVDIDPF